MLAMGNATQRFERDLDTFTTGEVAVLVRPTAEQTHSQTKAELERALTGVDRTRFKFEVSMDDTGHAWAVMKAEHLNELAAGAAQLGEAFGALGLGERVIAAVFPFRWRDTIANKDRRLYWVYQPRIAGFTPFVPDPDQGTEARDHNLEVRMESAVRRDLPTFPETTEWYPIWGMPV
jgi:hypothetical protein